MQMPGLAGKRVVVTAAASGIGFAIARTLDAAGCHVAICDIDKDALQAAALQLPQVMASATDVAHEESVEKFMRDAISLFGGLDALVNNAGIAGPTESVEKISTTDWQRCLDVGLTGHFLCTRAAVPHIKEAGGGSIVNMSSVVGKLGFAYRAPYSAVKFGVVGLTQSLAKELGPYNVRVNALLPGIVAGQRIQNVIDARAELLSTTSQQIEDELVSSVSLRRMVTAEDVAAMTAFLISGLGQNVSGQSIAVDANVETI